jgi:hypothetical protein
LPQHASRCHVFQGTEYIHGISNVNEAEGENWAATDDRTYWITDMHCVPRVATMETAMNGFKNSGMWPVDLYLFMDDDFAPYMVTDRPETIQLQKGLNTSSWVMNTQIRQQP